MEFDGALEEGLRAFDAKIPCPSCGEIDLLAVDRASQLTIIDFEMTFDDSLLLRGIGHFDWVVRNMPNVRRMYREQVVNFSLPPRLFLLAPQFSPLLRSVARQITRPQIHWVRYHTVDGFDAALGARKDVAHDHRRAFHGPQLAARREDRALRVEPRVERRDRRDADVLADVEEWRDHLHALALVEQQLRRRERLLGVDIVDHDHVTADGRLAAEHVAVRHDVLAVAAGDRRDVRMRAGGDDDRVPSLAEHEGRGRLHPQPDVHAELAHLGREEADDPRRLPANRRARGEEYLSAQLGRFLPQPDPAAPECSHPGGLEPGHAAADDHDMLGRRRPYVAELALASG